jgi:uncharacterized phage protein gp47/JayE|uniref:Baseplate J like protein n=1 Tax=Siphoviridae sp. ctVqj4 TaxID=2826359 RepID=A0A8S5NL94_9CAUD|nr:MAG TPA: Baseplate J like protein [Siphoviridae sp. ctVqj4]
MDYKKSSDIIQDEMLSEISDSYEKSKGYFLWDILKAIAIRLKAILYDLQTVADALDVENLSGERLERFIYQRSGLERKKATYSKGIVTVTGNGVVTKGDFFETEGFIRFQALKTVQVVETATVEVQAVEPGISGNVPANTIIKIPVTITGISKCTNKEATSEGYESEDDIDLKTRYYERLRMPATSGNVYHYKQWAKEIQGVGGAKVFPLWNGNNTVKVIIIDQDRLPASKELVADVQNYIDPGITGSGEGQAPIGAFCTVESAIAKNIDISVKITLVPGYEISVVKESIKEKIKNYLSDIAFTKNYISYAVIGASILAVEGVLDYENLRINGMTGNIECKDNEVMVLGSVNLDE